MHDIVIFSLLIVAIQRILGIGISIDFYIEFKSSRYKTLILGWSLWLIGGLLPLFSFIVNDPLLSQIFVLYNIIFTTLGLLVLAYNLTSNYLTIQKRYIIIYTVILFIVSHFLYFLANLNLTVSFVSIYQQIMWLYLILLPVFKWKVFRLTIDRHTWYYFFSILILGVLYIPIGIIIYLRGFSFGLYDSNDIVLVSFNYGYLVLITVLLNMLFVHLEYRLTQREKHALKDRYSHNLGNALQAIYTALELSKNYDLNENDEDIILKTSQDKIKEAAELLKEIRDL